MAKRKNPKKAAEKDTAKRPDNILPQNIVPFGERVEEDKNIYISQKVYKEIHRFTQDKITNESGGMLIGTTIEEFGKTNIVINGFIEAKHSEGTPTTLKFTHETWDYVHKEAAKKFPGQKIVGWIHTHPNFGIFLSEYDKFIQENFFKEDYQIAYVVDPIQNIEGFYFWINGKIERCSGFYVFDKNGVKITVNDGSKEDAAEISAPNSVFSFRNVLMGILAVLVVILIFMNMSLKNQIKEVEHQQETLVESANSSIYWLQQQIEALSLQINEINTILDSESDADLTPDTNALPGEGDISDDTNEINGVQEGNSADSTDIPDVSSNENTQTETQTQLIEDGVGDE